MGEEELSGIERARGRWKEDGDRLIHLNLSAFSRRFFTLNDLGSFTRTYSPSASHSLYHRMSRWDLKWFRSLMLFEWSERWRTVMWFVTFIRALDVSYLIQICRSFIDVCDDYPLHRFPSPGTTVGLYSISSPGVRQQVSISSVQRSVVWRDTITADQNILFSFFYCFIDFVLFCLEIFVVCLFVLLVLFCVGLGVFCVYYWFHFVFCFLLVFYWFSFSYVWSFCFVVYSLF